MNLFYKVYCRVFQTCFHLAIPLLPYRDPQILRQVGYIPAALKIRDIRGVLIVTDPAIAGLKLLEPLERELTGQGIRWTVFDGTAANPTVDNVEQARQLYLDQQCQALIGFGGGSSMDCAKAVGARIARPNKPLGSMRGILQVLRPIPLLIAVPTTAGTGSEVTLAAVITDAGTGLKFPINDFALIPKIAVLDTANTRTLPRSIAATTGMDALTHAVEAYIGRSTTRSTRRDALEAVRLVFASLERACIDGEEAAREAMLTAAFLAGRAFSKSYVGYIHAVAHSLGGQYNIPHGLANAVLMPYVLDAYGPVVYKRLHALAVAAGIAGPEDPPDDAAQRFIQAIRDMNRRMGIPAHLQGIRREDIPLLARRAAREANPLYPVPVLMGAEELEQFYYQAADWREP